PISSGSIPALADDAALRWRGGCWASVLRRSGRDFSASMMLVCTRPGHKTETPILNLPSDSRSESVRPRTANFDAVHHAAEIDTDDPVPVFVFGLFHRRVAAAAGIVADDMNLAEDALDLVGGARHRFAVGDVEPDEVIRQVRALEGRGGLIEMVLAHVRHHHFHAGLEEGARHAETDARCAAGDKSGLAVDVFHCSSFGFAS